MKSVDTIARVRRAFHVQGWSLKRISRELHVSRNTIRKILQVRRDVVLLRARAAADAEDRTVAGPARCAAGRQSWQAGARAADADPRSTRSFARSAMKAATTPSGATRRAGRRREGRRRPRPMCRCSSRRARPTSSTGATRSSLLNGVTVTVKVAHVRLCHSRMMFVQGLSARDAGDGVRRP